MIEFPAVKVFHGGTIPQCRVVCKLLSKTERAAIGWEKK
jgi:hypothetical protein